jgi:hypothetical protein
VLEFPYRAQLHCGRYPTASVRSQRTGAVPYCEPILSRENDAGRKHLVHVGYGPVPFLSGPDFSSQSFKPLSTSKVLSA